MKTHELKTWPSFFERVWDYTKLFEIRKNDRDFKVGDILILLEWGPDEANYTGRYIVAEVRFIMLGGTWGIEAGYCVMAIEILSRRP